MNFQATKVSLFFFNRPPKCCHRIFCQSDEQERDGELPLDDQTGPIGRAVPPVEGRAGGVQHGLHLSRAGQATQERN